MAEKVNPFDTMSKARKNEQEQLVEQAKTKKATATKTAKTTVTDTTEKRGVGAPVKDASKGRKKDYCKTINVAVPKDKLELVNEYGLVARGLSLTDYINLLIEQDLEKNLTAYKKEVQREPKFI